MWNMASKLDESTSFNGFNPFSYKVREGDGNEDHMDLAEDTIFVDL